MPNPWVKQWFIQGTSKKEYKVSQRQDGTFGCECPAWKFQKNPKKDCQHILSLKIRLLEQGKVNSGAVRSKSQSSSVDEKIRSISFED